MNRRMFLFFAVLLSTMAFSAQGPSKPRPATISGSFYRFLRVFITLLNNQKIQNNIKTLETLLTTLMQTAYQIIQSSKPALGITRNCRDEMALDPQLVQEMEAVIAQESKQIIIKKNQPIEANKRLDDPTKIILANFAGIVASFFNILQDPENKEVVAPNLINMVAGMVNIGAEAMKKDGPPLKAHYDELDRYVQNMDEDLKKEMLRIIFNEQKRTGIVSTE